MLASAPMIKMLSNMNAQSQSASSFAIFHSQVASQLGQVTSCGTAFTTNHVTFDPSSVSKFPATLNGAVVLPNMTLYPKPNQANNSVMLGNLQVQNLQWVLPSGSSATPSPIATVGANGSIYYNYLANLQVQVTTLASPTVASNPTFPVIITVDPISHQIKSCASSVDVNGLCASQGGTMEMVNSVFKCSAPFPTTTASRPPAITCSAATMGSVSTLLGSGIWVCNGSDWAPPDAPIPCPSSGWFVANNPYPYCATALTPAPSGTPHAAIAVPQALGAGSGNLVAFSGLWLSNHWQNITNSDVQQITTMHYLWANIMSALVPLSNTHPRILVLEPGNGISPTGCYTNDQFTNASSWWTWLPKGGTMSYDGGTFTRFSTSSAVSWDPVAGAAPNIFAQQINNYDAVILMGFSSWMVGTETIFRQYVDSGHSLLVFSACSGSGCTQSSNSSWQPGQGGSDNFQDVQCTRLNSWLRTIGFATQFNCDAVGSGRLYNDTIFSDIYYYTNFPWRGCPNDSSGINTDGYPLMQ